MGGFHFLTCMKSVMAHIRKGRETRVTQLYTDKIVRCIIRGVKNQMLWNIAYGTKATKESEQQDGYI